MSFKKILVTILAVVLISSWQLSAKPVIQLALLLDTSNSMDGLINQAKAKLWKIVNELSKAQFDSQDPQFQVALYEYGNNNLAQGENYLRMVAPFTSDLDLLSDQLFKLTTNGGSEYCGAVIKSALNELRWSDDPNSLKIIYIAGNEPFNQGYIDYKQNCRRARENNISLNTIFCGNYQEGINTLWQDGARIGGGDFLTIDHNQDIVYRHTPYDDEIVKMGSLLNQTYLSYGSQGEKKKEMQSAQDKNAASMNEEVLVSRSISKAGKYYKNESWDMVDAVKEKKLDLEKIAKKDLPKEMQNLNLDEQKKYLKQKEAEREKLQTAIRELEKKRSAFIEEKISKDKNNNTLDQAIINSLRKLCKAKNYSM